MVSFVIPCYRSENTLPNVVTEISATMAARGDTYEIILVNDCSPDATWQTICHLSESDGHITGVDLARNFGQHSALMAGFSQAGGDVIVCLDDDGQTPANEAGKLLDKLAEGYDVVYAAYDSKKQSAFRNWGSALNSRMLEVMMDKPHDLVINSYFAMQRFIMEDILHYSHCYPYVEGLVLRATKNICNVPVHHRERQQGRSGYTLRSLFSLWMNGFTSFSVKPLRIANYFGLFSAFCGMLYLIFILINYAIDPTVPMGWSSTTAILLLLGGVILVVLGVIGEYIGRIYMCINESPQYVVRRTVGKAANKAL